MIAHELKIGQRIYDCRDERWGEVLLIGGKDEDKWVDEDDMIITYKPEDSDGECETWAIDSYPYIIDKRFKGEDICMEINIDEFDMDHDYDYYCPENGENCWEFELD